MKKKYIYISIIILASVIMILRFAALSFYLVSINNLERKSMEYIPNISEKAKILEFDMIDEKEGYDYLEIEGLQFLFPYIDKVKQESINAESKLNTYFLKENEEYVGGIMFFKFENDNDKAMLFLDTVNFDEEKDFFDQMYNTDFKDVNFFTPLSRLVENFNIFAFKVVSTPTGTIYKTESNYIFLGENIAVIRQFNEGKLDYELVIIINDKSKDFNEIVKTVLGSIK